MENRGMTVMEAYLAKLKAAMNLEAAARELGRQDEAREFAIEGAKIKREMRAKLKEVLGEDDD